MSIGVPRTPTECFIHWAFDVRTARSKASGKNADEETKSYFSEMQKTCEENNLPQLAASAKTREAEVAKSMLFKGKSPENERAVRIRKNDNPYQRVFKSALTDELLKNMSPEMQKNASAIG